MEVAHGLRQQAFDVLHAVGILENGLERVSFRGAHIAAANFVHAAAQIAEGVQGHFGSARDAVGIRRHLRKRDEPAAVGSDQQAEVLLQVAAQFSKRSVLIGGIKNQQAAELRVGVNGLQRRIVQAVRQMNGEDYVVEEIHHRRSLGGDPATRGVDRDVVGVHADFRQHGGHQGGFVFAVSVLVQEDFRRGVRLPSADAELDGDITNIALDKRGDGLHLAEKGRRRSGQRRYFLSDFGRSSAAIGGKLRLPLSHVVPRFEAAVLESRRRRERNHKLARDAPPGRHVGYFANAGDILEDPLPLVGAGGNRRDFGVIEPGGFVLPARRQLQRIVGLRDGVRVLEYPVVLKNIRTRVGFHFVTDDVAGLRRRNVKVLCSDVGNQLGILDAEKRAFDGVLVFHFVVFALRRNAPAFHGGDFFVGAESYVHFAVVASTGAKNFVGTPRDAFYLAVGLDDGDVFRIEEDRVGLFVMRWKRRVDGRVHPRGGVRAARRERRVNEKDRKTAEGKRASHGHGRLSCWPPPWRVEESTAGRPES